MKVVIVIAFMVFTFGLGAVYLQSFRFSLLIIYKDTFSNYSVTTITYLIPINCELENVESD